MAKGHFMAFSFRICNQREVEKDAGYLIYLNFLYFPYWLSSLTIWQMRNSELQNDKSKQQKLCAGIFFTQQ